MSTKTDIVQLVADFNESKFGFQPKAIISAKQEDCDFLIKAMTEEVAEYAVSVDHGDIIGQVDALIDNIYFAIGGMIRMGMSADQIKQCFEVVHAHNMKKSKGVVESRNTGAADAVKPDDWVGPEEEIGKILGDTWVS